MTSSALALDAQLGLRRDPGARSLSFYATSPFIRINRDILEFLERVSQENGACNARICLHSSPESNFHEMVILEYQNVFYRPHRHFQKSESCHILRGNAAVFEFSDCGEVTNVAVLGEDRDSICRIGPEAWHTVIPLTPSVTYHESKPGPFVRDKDRIFPDWAPAGNDPMTWQPYQSRLIDLALRGCHPLR